MFPSNTNKVVLSLSGGVDSTTLLGCLLSRNIKVHAVLFDYGSKHNSYEKVAANALFEYYKKQGSPFTLQIVDLQELFKASNSTLLKKGAEIPEGHYQAETMKSTVVPCRNLIFASILSSIAESTESEYVCLGVHAGDHAIYPDCRPDFINSLRSAVEIATEGKVSVLAPFVEKTKADIIDTGIMEKIPYHLTRSCYKQQDVSCGKCGTCVERIEAFELNEIKDPIVYAK